MAYIIVEFCFCVLIGCVLYHIMVAPCVATDAIIIAFSVFCFVFWTTFFYKIGKHCGTLVAFLIPSASPPSSATLDEADPGGQQPQDNARLECDTPMGHGSNPKPFGAERTQEDRFAGRIVDFV
jgi:hypothetical protein